MTQGNDQPHEHIGEPGTAGISVIGVTCSIRHNIVHHIGYSGIAIQGVERKRCSPQVLYNVCYRNMGGGIGSMRGSTAVIEANVCFQNFYAGIGHEDSSPLVINNVCYENIRAGIGISEGSKPIVRGNECFRNRRAGIGIRTGADTSPIGQGGIKIRQPIDTTIVVGNNFESETDREGVDVTGGQAIVENNRVEKPKPVGVKETDANNDQKGTPDVD